MTDTPEEAKARRELETVWNLHLEQLAGIRAACAELEKMNHPQLAWARAQLQKAETVHEAMVNAIATNGHIDVDEELAEFLIR